VVMKKTTVIAGAMVMLLFGNWTQAGVSVVKNGSFENDGPVPDITAKAPKYWCDVNVPSGFYGWVSSAWSTHPYDGDGNSLALCWYDNTTEANNIATVSQQVYLKDVNQITFDIKLDTDYWPDIKWDPNKFSAVVMIDANCVWNSNTLEMSGSDEYHVEVNDIDINDANLHILSLAMRVNIVGGSPLYVYYRAWWDFTKFETHCGGFGYLPGDLNQSCHIDFLDFAMLAGHWLEPNPAYKYDLYEDEDSIVNEYDLMVFTDGWLDCSKWEDANCFKAELLDADLNDDGVVDLRDFAILAKDWKVEGPCIRGDIYRFGDSSGVVDYKDVFVLADEWLLKSWLYGLD